ncbi:DUF6138 family protein [Achromobacter sp. SLBN-14]|uniref:DUF6138 family protein n=1 Tax=Achromobacter sp. SLBN-14 TaxID=2768442 RepID=UPI00114E5DED|nr:DUF6138 family protein [Achromobacter sp. SLBN-14]TQJ94290.1 hypothetical protein FBY20_1016 [Achromobacter sp. SLBN-14]
MSDVSRPIGLHHKTAQAIQDETLAAIHRWFDTLQARDDIDAIVARTPLQVGIHSEILLEYEPSRIVFDVMPSWEPDDQDGLHAEGRNGPLSPDAVHTSLAPVLREAVRERIARLAGTRAPVRERLFGSDKKLAALARKADGPHKARLLRLLEC